MAEFRLTPEERAIQPEREQRFIEALYRELANAAQTWEPVGGDSEDQREEREAARWQLLTHHGVLLLAVASAPDARIRELATTTGVTERTCHRIINDLCAAGYLQRRRVGRRNFYELNGPSPSEGGEVARLLKVLKPRPRRHDAPRGAGSRRQRS